MRTKTYGNNVETQTYDYNICGWLKEMSGNYFSEKLYYEKNRSNGAGCYNGNISQSDLRYHAGNHNASLAIGLNSAGTLLQFDYTYDYLNRLRLARTSDSYVRFTEEMDYD